MMNEVRSRFDRADLRPLWAEVRRRLEEADGPVRSVRVPLRTDGERAALADLLGMSKLPGDGVTVRMDRLDAVLGEVGLDSRTVVEAIAGPLRPLAAQRRERAAAREELWSWVAGHPDVAAEPALRAWGDYVRARGLIDDSPVATRWLLTQVFGVLRELPAGGGSLAEFAERVCGDPHALDGGRLATYVLRALACRYDEPVPAGAAERRALWERAGIACDALSVSVLVAGLRPHGDSALAGSCRAWADAGQPTRLTLAQVRTAAHLRLDADVVWVVENPAVVAAARDRFGPACPPVVCTSGWPNTAVIELLRRLGPSPRVHADLDGEGLRIAAYVLAKVGGEPWRMRATDYLAAVPETGPPAGRVSEVPWDVDLAAAMRGRGVALYEERVVGDLLDDLASPT
ncbi:MAG TPA: TIGR02679 family protein [Streptosporangiaceae bacterium]